MAKKELDPLTYEILWHRVDQIIAEAYYTISHISGSAIVMEVGDHQEALMNARGDLVMFGTGLVHWMPLLTGLVEKVARDYQENPGIHEGDQFIANDVYTSASHGPDIQLLAPIFYKGELIAWGAAAAHQVDIGGIDPGGIMVRSTECYQEGIQFPAVKFVEKGMIRKDLADFIRSSVRTPDFAMMEISSKIAANNVIRSRVVSLCDRYGVDTILTLFDQMVESSTKIVSAKLAKIPDGKWRAVHYNEGINTEKLPFYKVMGTLTKEGDSLTYDLAGSSPQSPQSENTALPATIGNLLGGYAVTVGHDVPFSSGLWKNIKFMAPEGSIANPRRPAACSYTTPSGSGYTIEALGQKLVALMLQSAEDPELRKESSGIPGGAVHCPDVAGINQYGEYAATEIMDGNAGGMGGLPDRDGDATAGNMWCPKSSICDVEMNEILYPILAVYRREIPDTGGPGKFRGGNAFENAWIPWDTQYLDWVGVGHGFHMRSSTGVSGGYPAANTSYMMLRNTDLREQWKQGKLPTRPEDIKGERDYPYPKSFTYLGPNDINACVQCGGGGYGDPLERDPELALKDVKNGDVTIPFAREAYGVVIDSKTITINVKETEKQRKEMIEERLREGSK